jgi:PAS domain S-box-containing protein
MEISTLPDDEAKRLEAVRNYHILDTETEPDFDSIVHLACQLIGTPIAIITILDEKRQWFKAELGLGIRETPRDLSFCAHAIHLDDVLVINDAKDDTRFFDNPLVTDNPNIRFYAGMPIVVENGFKVGTLAVIDVVPRQLTDDQLENIRILARQVSNLLQLRRSVKSLRQANNEMAVLVEEKTKEFKDALERLTDAFVAVDDKWRFTYLNSKAEQILGKGFEYLVGKQIWIEHSDIFSVAFHDLAELAMREQQPQRLEEYYPSQDLWFEVHIYPSHKGVTFYFDEITQRKKDEDKILQLNERASLIEKATNDIIWDWDMLTDELTWNEKYFTYLGYDPKTTPSGPESWLRVIHPEDEARIEKEVQEVIASGNNYWSDEYRLIKSDKSLIHVLGRGFVIYDLSGKPFRMVGSIMDITKLKENEEKIALEKELSDSIINGLPGIFYLYDENGKFIRWNKNFETISGYSAEEISKMHPLDFFHESQKELLTERIGKVFSTGNGEVEAYFYTKDKRKIPYYFNGWRVKYENKICLNGVGIDITDRMKVEGALYKNWETYKNLFEANPLPMWMYELETLTFVKVNRAAVLKYGYSEDEFMQMTISDIRPREDVEKLKKSIQQGSPVINTSPGWKHITKEGKVLDVVIYSHAIFYDDKDCRLIVANDVTEKIKAEEQYKTIFDNSLEGIFQTSLDGKIRKANPSLAKMIGYDSPQELMATVKDLGKEIYANPEDRTNIKKLMKKEGKIYGLEVKALKKDGTPIWVRANMRTVCDSRGEIEYFEGTLEDITDRKNEQEKLKRQYKELQKTNYELDRFVYSVSHDLRAPLASVLGLVNVAEMENPPASFLAYLMMIRESVNRLEGFIKDILDYSRNSRLEVKTKKIDLKAIINEVKKNLSYMKGAGRLKLNIRATHTGEFYSDPMRMRIILNNLLSNSIKFQDPEKVALIVDVSVKTNGKMSILTYSDNGIGIAEDQLGKIFDMFHRASDKAAGSGLGLYVVKETLLKLNGSIKVWSTLGHSTTFEISIPNES